MVECFVHIEKVIGSNPISPTFFMIKKYIKILLNTFFYINLNIFNCYSADRYLENRYFTMSLKNYIINCTEELSSRIDDNNFTDFKLDIKNIKEDNNISELLENDEGELKFSPPKNITVDVFLKNCYDIYSKHKCYDLFTKKFRGMENDNKYKIADIFLKLLIIELNYEEKTSESLEKYNNDKKKDFDKVKSSNKKFFENFYGAKFFFERAKALIIVNKSLLKSIELMIERYNDADEQKKKDKILDFIINQTYNKMLNIDYLWILYTYGYRASKTFSKTDRGFAPFAAEAFKEYFS